MTESGILTKYFGFTENEVKELCQKYEINFDTIKQWYNGYHIDDEHMYNPNSVCRAMLKKKVKSYWKDTSAFETVNQYITLNFDGLKEDVIKMLNGESVNVDKNADTALRQIKEKRYDGCLKGYGNEILLVGVNYDKKKKKHECVIESIGL